jgi:ubiquinone/menaquinone biosynthesis C-methylase UbiE
MSLFTDPKYLTNNQYRDSSNLDARLTIHQRFSTNPYGWFNWVFDKLVQLPKEANILELGCGSGMLWKECASRIPEGWVITLSDLSHGMLDAAWRNLVTLGRYFKFEQIDAQAIPYGDETFDAVIANHMLYHVPDRPKALAEIKRVLKSGGRLIATTVGDQHLKEMYEWLARGSLKSFESFANPFTLENGLEQLRPFFANVTSASYPDDLHITEVEPIMAYIRSTFRTTELSQNELASIARGLEKEIQEKGYIFIQKDSGLFEVIK